MDKRMAAYIKRSITKLETRIHHSTDTITLASYYGPLSTIHTLCLKFNEHELANKARKTRKKIIEKIPDLQE